MNNVMTPEEFKEAMKNAIVTYDFNGELDEELTHVVMDNTMCDLLRSLGYGEGIDIFCNTPKWYS